MSKTIKGVLPPIKHIDGNKRDLKRLPPANMERTGKVDNSSIINTKRLPPITSRIRRGSSGSKRMIYGVFHCSYADWTKFARYIANGQYENVFEPGTKQTADTRMYWLTKIDPVSEVETWVATLTTKEARNYELKADEQMRVAINFNENVPKIAYHEQFRNLGPKFEQVNKYHGFVSTFKENIDKLQKNVRGFVALNPEYDDVFGELPVYESIYVENVDRLSPIKNEEYVEPVEA